MKKYDLVLLNKIRNEYVNKNLEIGMYGLVLEAGSETSKVLFFNNANLGDFCLIDIENSNLLLQKEKLPEKIIKQLVEKINPENKKDYLNPCSFKEFDKVELLVEDDRYSQFGVHKGDIGFVLENKSIKNYILVDFQKIDKNNEITGDVISVNETDLKKL